MPEEATATTALAADLSAKTTAAVQETGFGKDWDAQVDAAIASDAAAMETARTGQSAPKPAEAAPAAPAKPAAEKKEPAKAAAVPDIPAELLGKKEKPAAEPAQTDADREKFIKEQTAGLSPKAADRFRAIEAKAHEAEKRAARVGQLEKELTAAQEKLKASVDSSATEALQKQIEELDGIVKKTALTEHPKFKAAFDGKIDGEIAIASKLVPKEAAAEVAALLSLPETAQRNRRLNEIAGELEPLEANKFHAAVDRADRLAAEKASELTNWKVNAQRVAEMSQAEQKQTTEQKQRLIETAVANVTKKFGDDEKGIELFRKVDGNDEWNKGVEGRLAHVRKLTEAELGREDIAEMAAWAMSGAEYRKLFLTQRVLVQRLQEEIASMKGGEPDLGAGGVAADAEETGGMIDVVSRLATKEGAVR